MKRFLTNDRVLRFYKWKSSTNRNRILWTIVRPLFGLGCLCIASLLCTGGSLAYSAMWFLWLVCNFPGFFINLGRLWGYTAKALKFGLIKPGTLLEVDLLMTEGIDGLSGRNPNTTVILRPVEIVEYLTAPKPTFFDSDYETNMYEKHIECSEQSKHVRIDEIMMAVETEVFPSKLSFGRLIGSDLHLTRHTMAIYNNLPRIKVLYDGKLYWADSRRLRKIRRSSKSDYLKPA